MLRFSPKTIIGRSSMNLDGRLLGLAVADTSSSGDFAGHRHGVGDRADLKRNVHCQVALRRDQDRFPNDGSESLLLNDQAVGPDRKAGGQVVPEFVGLENRVCCSSRCSPPELWRRDDGSVRILHGPFDAAAVGLRKQDATLPQSRAIRIFAEAHVLWCSCRRASGQ